MAGNVEEGAGGSQKIFSQGLTNPRNFVTIEFVGVCGRSSVVERHLAKVNVVGSNPIARF